MTVYVASSPFLNDVDRPVLNPANEFIDRIRGDLPENPRCLFIASNPEDHFGTCLFGSHVATAFSDAGMPFSSFRVLDAYNAEDAAELIMESDLIVLAGFMSILSENFTSNYPDRILNVHPSLIPSFCGKGYYGLRVHEEALAYGVKVTGATVHFVNEIPDGGRIILQKAVEIEEGDTPEVLQRRVMEQAEWKILPEAVEIVSKQLIADRKE